MPAFDKPQARPAPARSGSVLIVEEKPICRMALSEVLAAGGVSAPPLPVARPDEVAGFAPAQVALALIDLFTVNYDFRWLAGFVAQVWPAPVVALDDRNNPAFADLARKAGVAAYGSKDQPLSELQALFAAAASGPAPALERTAGEAAPRHLTRREREVLAQLGQGRTNREIADLLHITPGTVKLHIHRILKVTGARNRTEAALISGRFLAAALRVEAG